MQKNRIDMRHCGFFDYYKFNSALRSVYAGYWLILLKKAYK